jgi:hypothetical protein
MRKRIAMLSSRKMRVAVLGLGILTALFLLSLGGAPAKATLAGYSESTPASPATIEAESVWLRGAPAQPHPLNQDSRNFNPLALPDDEDNITADQTDENLNPANPIDRPDRFANTKLVSFSLFEYQKVTHLPIYLFVSSLLI